MLRLVLSTDKGPIGVVAINKDNMMRMRAGMPLAVDFEEVLPPGEKSVTQFYVHYADTYADAVDDMFKGGIPVTQSLRDLAKKLDEELDAQR